jgi:hypothetical protein
MKIRLSVLLTIIAAIVGLVWAAVERTDAATSIVPNTNDSEPGSLRYAIADGASGDTINSSVTGTIATSSSRHNERK